MVSIGDRSFLEMTVPTFLPATALPPPDYRPLAEAALSLHTLARNDPQPLGPASRAVCGETSNAYTPRRGRCSRSSRYGQLSAKI